MKETLAVSLLELKIDNGRYKDQEIGCTVAVADNVLIGTLEIYVDGKMVKQYDGEEILRLKGKIPLTIKSSDEFQSIYAIAADAAGNVTQSNTIKVLVTANLWIQFYRNTLLLAGTAAGSIATGLGIFMLARRFWKKRYNPQ